jgi:hypothetical protein
VIFLNPVPRVCEAADCTNYLPPYRGRGRRQRFCSKGCLPSVRKERESRAVKAVRRSAGLRRYPYNPEAEVLAARWPELAQTMRSQTPTRLLRPMADSLEGYPVRGALAQAILTDRYDASKGGYVAPPGTRHSRRPGLWTSVAMRDSTE